MKRLPAAQFLRESGLLFEINRKVLHPLGLALEIKLNDDGSYEMSQALQDWRDEGGIYFGEDSVQRGEECLKQFLEGLDAGGTPGEGNT
jgi:hypothetical protein